MLPKTEVEKIGPLRLKQEEPYNNLINRTVDTWANLEKASTNFSVPAQPVIMNRYDLFGSVNTFDISVKIFMRTKSH